MPVSSDVVTLKLVLEALGVPTTIQRLNERKYIQKAIFLAQAAGVDLGYSYGWYLRGPYSPRLTRDYFALDEALTAGDGLGTEDVRLRKDVSERLHELRDLFQVPVGVDLLGADWLELLASLRYLETTRRLHPDEADRILETEKPRLWPYREMGRATLESRLAA